MHPIIRLIVYSALMGGKLAGVPGHDDLLVAVADKRWLVAIEAGSIDRSRTYPIATFLVIRPAEHARFKTSLGRISKMSLAFNCSLKSVRSSKEVPYDRSINHSYASIVQGKWTSVEHNVEGQAIMRVVCDEDLSKVDLFIGTASELMQKFDSALINDAHRSMVKR